MNSEKMMLNYLMLETRVGLILLFVDMNCPLKL